MKKNRGRRVDAASLSKNLAPNQLPTGLTQESANQAIREMAHGARRLMIVNDSGGLPGPPRAHTSLVRRILNLLDRDSSRN